MATYEFQSSLYRNSAEMLAAIADAYLSAGGENGLDAQLEILATMTDTDLADDCIIEWGLDRPRGEDWEGNPGPSHMERGEYSMDDLVEAFARQRRGISERIAVINGRKVDIDEVADLMDDELREDVHAELAPCSAQEFLDAYVKRHAEKFDGEEFLADDDDSLADDQF